MMREVARIKGMTYNSQSPAASSTSTAASFPITGEALSNLAATFGAQLQRARSFTVSTALAANTGVVSSVAARDMMRRASLLNRKASAHSFADHLVVAKRAKSKDASAGGGGGGGC
eukprot:GILJ01040172.1.p1 GENE.GILJ01040172.1~~GILJ01040172.1.p1  ORF type:complete len:123 (-),score=29.57 GILJ01040172.1:17-364(-)